MAAAQASHVRPAEMHGPMLHRFPPWKEETQADYQLPREVGLLIAFHRF